MVSVCFYIRPKKAFNIWHNIEPLIDERGFGFFKNNSNEIKE